MRLSVLTLSLFLGSIPASAAGPGPAAAISPPPGAARPTGSMPVIAPGGSQSANCPVTSRYQAMKQGSPLAGRKLSELPAADLYMAVYRKIDGCEVPIIAGYGYGAARK